MQTDKYIRPASHFDLPSASDIWGNLKAGASNLKLAVTGHPVDALTQSAIQRAVQDTGVNTSKISATKKAALTSPAAVAKVQADTVTDIKAGVGSIFSGLKTYLILGVVILVLILLVRK